MRQELLKDGFELRRSAGKEEGCFSLRRFHVDEIVMVGTIEQRLSENHSHASQVGEDEYVFHAGQISKVNHSCDPNCGIKVNETGAHDFVAMRDISVDEELTFDYAMRNHGVDYFPKQCACKAEGCRGEITGWKDLPKERRDEYAGYVAPYLLEMDA